MIRRPYDMLNNDTHVPNPTMLLIARILLGVGILSLILLTVVQRFLGTSQLVHFWMYIVCYALPPCLLLLALAFRLQYSISKMWPRRILVWLLVLIVLVIGTVAYSLAMINAQYGMNPVAYYTHPETGHRLVVMKGIDVDSLFAAQEAAAAAQATAAETAETTAAERETTEADAAETTAAETDATEAGTAETTAAETNATEAETADAGTAGTETAEAAAEAPEIRYVYGVYVLRNRLLFAPLLGGEVLSTKGVDYVDWSEDGNQADVTIFDVDGVERHILIDYNADEQKLLEEYQRQQEQLEGQDPASSADEAQAAS